MIDWMTPSDDIVEARQIGRNDRDDEVLELQAEIERLWAELEDAQLALGVYAGYRESFGMTTEETGTIIRARKAAEAAGGQND